MGPARGATDNGVVADTTAEAPVGSGAQRADSAAIDTDVHARLPGIETLEPYLSAYWNAVVADAGAPWFNEGFQLNYPPGAPTTSRSGTEFPPSTEQSATLIERVRTDVLDAGGLQHAVLTSIPFTNVFRNPDLAAALATAVNDWIIAEWLASDTRLLGSVLADPSNPTMAAAEIDRVGGHPGVVQLLLPARTAVPYGNRTYQPIFDAAIRNGLAVAIHHGGWPATASSSSGWFSYYVEEYVSRGQVFQAQMLSMITEGTFERYPDLRVAFLESGFAWLPAFLWRFDKDWKGLRRETPWLRRPSDYVREHFRFSTEPFDGPRSVEFLNEFADQVGSADVLMFASDYPHWHRDPAADPLPQGLDDETRARILSGTARAFYQLES